jgi:Ankyrin repeats (3 copies)
MAFGKRDDSSMQKEPQDTATVALSPCSERGVDDMTDADQSAVSRVLSDPTLLAHCMQFQDGLMHREYWNGDHAATSGHLSLIRDKEALKQPLSYTHLSINGAAKQGHLEVLKHLQHICETSKAAHGGAPSATVAAMDGAAARGHLHVLEYLHTHRTEGCSKFAMNEAASEGHLATVQWLDRHCLEVGCTEKALDGAASNGHLEVVKWLHENRREGATTDALDGAAGNGTALLFNSFNKLCNCDSGVSCTAVSFM